MPNQKWIPATALIIGLVVAAHAAAPTKPVFEGNEAVSADKKTGERRVELPPFLEKSAVDGYGQPTAPKPTWLEDINQGSPPIWYMIEGPNGLLECGGLSIHDNACRQPTLGRYKWKRNWVIKKDGQWLMCTGGKKPYRCARRGQIVALATRPGDVPE